MKISKEPSEEEKKGSEDCIVFLPRLRPSTETLLVRIWLARSI